MADAGEKCIVNRGVTEAARHSDPLDAVALELRPETDHGVLPQKLLRSPDTEGVIHQELHEVQPIHVDLEAEPKRLQRLDVVLDHLVQARRIAPEHLLSERVVPEDVAALSREIVRWFRHGKLPAPGA
ncbi:MAG: hypothetical protein KY464_11855 [Gemmatimonadetes bacterium]|nr:hypothetical protein [Gemmatimonadota bacterium]